MLELNQVYCGDCLEVMSDIDDNSVSGIVTDPPSGINFMGKKWDSDKGGRDQWIEWLTTVMKECLRTIKPGGMVLVWALPRTSHWTATAIENAGFVIRDKIYHLFGCLSEDTEILTTNGWERYHKTIDNSSVLCYDMAKDEFVFDKPLRSFCYENEYTAYRIKSNFTDQIVSRGHRCIVERKGKWVFQRPETWECEKDIPFLESLRVLPETIYDVQSHTSVTKSDLLKKVFGQQISYRTSRKTIRQKCKMGVCNLPNLWKTIRPARKENQIHRKTFLWEKMLWYLESTRFRNTKTSSENSFKRERWLDRRKYEKLPNKYEWGKQSCMERRCDIFQNAWKLCWSKICQMSQRIFRYGTKGWVCYGTPSYHGTTFGTVFGTKGNNSSYRSQSEEQRSFQSDVISNKQSTQNIRRTRVKITPIEYNGKVWCVQVSTGAFVARRNGKIFITGNSGFPKSSSISKNIDKKLGKERKVVGKREHPTLKDKSKVDRQESTQYHGANPTADEWELTEPSSDEAKLFDGYGTALKPATEEWILAMKPLDGTFAENALKHGVAGLNINCGRVETDENLGRLNNSTSTFNYKNSTPFVNNSAGKGRWPANLILQHHPECIKIGTKKVKSAKPTNVRKSIVDGGNYGNSRQSGLGGHADQNGNETIEEYQCHSDCPIRLLNEQVGIKKSGTNCVRTKEGFFLEHGGMGKAGDKQTTYGDQGYVSRYFKNLPPDTNGFFYSPKASRSERNKGCEKLGDTHTLGPMAGRGQEGLKCKKCNKWKASGSPCICKIPDFEKVPFKRPLVQNSHPTIKSLALMKYLVTLIQTPTKGIILDPFGGSGTTAVACEQLKIPYIIIEKEAEYCEIAKCRIEAANDPEPIKKTKKVVKQTNTLFDWNELDLEIK